MFGFKNTERKSIDMCTGIISLFKQRRTTQTIN